MPTRFPSTPIQVAMILRTSRSIKRSNSLLWIQWRLSAKHVRDAVAAWAGVDDGDVERIRFVVSQSKGAAGVRIIVRRRDGA